MKYHKTASGLPASARGEIMAAVCRSHGVSVTEARVRADRDGGFADRLAKEVNAVLSVLDSAYTQATGKASRLREKTTRTLSKNYGTSLRRELADAFKKSGARMSPMESLKLDAKSGSAFDYARAHIKPGKKMTDQEAVVVYSCTRRTSMEMVSLLDVERNFLTQDSTLVSIARKYCRSIGLNT